MWKMDTSVTATNVLGMKLNYLYIHFGINIYFVLKQFTSNCFVSIVHITVEGCSPNEICHVLFSAMIQ